ncbi:hypothetical protein WICPIJ_006470 [Wickerhamomyces pijperi]|uniref:Uncharacterized protein n=1 Tax=Wickerhamomyces pijperi TaxID=599730 RepID=A0A9P8Q1L3_WICPI|nr:hypothetical protein WICPIJ_006470 [Wickerhamomyces pijperi]
MSKELSVQAKKIKQLFDDIFKIRDTLTGQEIYFIFNTVPDKKLYPDYFQIINTPTSLNSIKKRYATYPSPNDFIKDVAQIVWNAKTYNQTGSDVYRFAEQLDTYLKETVIPKLSKSGYDVGYPDLTPITQHFAGTLYPYGTVPPAPAAPVLSAASVDELSFQNTRQGTPMTNDEGSVILEDATDHDYSRRSRGSTAADHSAFKRGRPPVIDKPFEQRIKNSLKALKKERDRNNNLVTSFFEKLPDKRDFPEYFNVIASPISLDEIRKKIKQRKYKDVIGFIEDINLMLGNAKVFNEDTSPVYQQALDFERMFRSAIDEELARPDSEYIQSDSLRIPLDRLEVNGIEYKIGDWVLISNPNDANKPTVAQLFRIWETEKGQRWINACWYLRPEQTVHRVDRLFLENEVFKSGQYRDHPCEEIIGHCFVSFFTRYQRGTPAFQLKGPMFICEFRYNDNDKNFNKIRTWKACLPDEVRDQEDLYTPLPNMRIFTKHESPLKKLLPANAHLDMPIPEPVYAAPNAPPLHGAVYLRGVDESDDLGQYANSPTFPKYIIRPNDPPSNEDRIIPTPQTNVIKQQLKKVADLSQSPAPLGVSGFPVPPQMPAAVPQIQVQHFAHQPVYHATPSYAPPTASTSFTLPISINQNSSGVLRMDATNNARRIGNNSIVQTAPVVTEGPLIWFRSASLNIQNRFIPDMPKTQLNRIAKRDLEDDYEENEDDDFVTRPGNGIAGSVRLGHSAAYIAHKLRKLNEQGADQE